jgi:hypothetical protein
VGGARTHFFDSLWIHLYLLGLIRNHYDSLGPAWTASNTLGITCLDLLGLARCRLDSLGLLWTHLISLCLTWEKN